jgi:hypothetical protein
MTFGARRWWGCQPHAPALFTPEMFLALIFTRGWVDPRAMERSEGDMSLKNPVTPPGIDPGNVRLVAQRLKHYATPGRTVMSVSFVQLDSVKAIHYCGASINFCPYFENVQFGEILYKLFNLWVKLLAFWVPCIRAGNAVWNFESKEGLFCIKHCRLRDFKYFNAT